VIETAAPVKALPAADALAILRERVKALAEKLTAKNGREVKAELLEKSA
jgi:hypothetical protein